LRYSKTKCCFTTKKFLETEKKVEDFRVLLWSWLGLNELFEGNGYTMSEKGVKGSSEYLVDNKNLKEMIDNGARIIKLEI